MQSAASAPARSMPDWFETAPRPRLLLAIIVAALYAPSLALPFMIDDYRNLRLMEDYRAGHRPALGLYGFLDSPDQAREAQRRGYFPWWVDPDLRFRFFRPIAERMLYLDFLLFGRAAWGYRLVSIAWYVAAVWLALALFRLVGEERPARWASLVFAVAGANAIPVIFPAARCDLVALVGGLGAAVMVGRYLLRGGIVRLALAAALFAMALGSKEASVPLAAAPPLLAWALRRKSPLSPARLLTATAVFALLGLGLLGYYATNAYGSNGAVMLDPLRAPADYLLRGPIRALMYLSCWVIPVNPFLFEQRGIDRPALYLFGVVGAVALLCIARVLWRHHRRQPGVPQMTLWPLLFMPVLVCTPVDNRVLLLPSVGLAYLAGVWLARRRDDGRVRQLPWQLFVAISAFVALCTTGVVYLFERQARADLQSAAAAPPTSPHPPEAVFVLNTPNPFFALWAQDRAESLLGRDAPRVFVLSDVIAPRIQIIDRTRIALTADDPLMESFIGRLPRRRGRPWRTGDAIDIGEYRARVTSVENGHVRALEFTFRRPLDSPAYRFVTLGRWGGVQNGLPASPATPVTPTRPASR